MLLLRREKFRTPGFSQGRLIIEYLSVLFHHSVRDHLQPKIKTVNCSESALNKLPDNIPKNVNKINLSHNKINAVVNKMFDNLADLVVLVCIKLIIFLESPS